MFPLFNHPAPSKADYIAKSPCCAESEYTLGFPHLHGLHGTNVAALNTFARPSAALGVGCILLTKVVLVAVICTFDFLCRRLNITAGIADDANSMSGL